MSENHTKELATSTPTPLAQIEFTRDQIDLIKRTVAKGTTDDEFKLFLYTARRTGLDPLAKQIHAIKRWDGGLQRNVMAIQTGIDGYRLMAERTQRYAPGQAPKYEYKPDGSLLSATAYVKKYSQGAWHEIAATAFYDEFVQKAKGGAPNSMWTKMPHNQLAKCAEALALRKAFPAEMSGVYTHEEMAQADNTPASAQNDNVQPYESYPATATEAAPKDYGAYESYTPPTPAIKIGQRLITEKQRKFLFALWKQTGRPDAEMKEYLKAHHGITSSTELTSDKMDAVLEWIKAPKKTTLDDVLDAEEVGQ